MRRRAKIGQEPWFKQKYYDRKEQYRAFTGVSESPLLLHTPGITQGIRPGIGHQNQYCDCSAGNKVSTNNFVTILVSVQYLSLMCMKYCAVLSGLKWRPEYMPLSTTTTSTTTTAITTTATTIPSTTATAIIEELQQRDEQSENANDDFTSTWKKTQKG